MPWFDRLSASYKRQQTLDELLSLNVPSTSTTQTHPRKRIKRGNVQDSHASPLPASPRRRSSSSENDAAFANIQFEPKPANESDDDITPSSPVHTRSKRKILNSDEEASNLVCENDSSGDEHQQGIGVRWKAATQKTKRVIQDSEDESNDRKDKKRIVKGLQISSDECDELDESQIIESRLRNRAKGPSRFQKNLEKLKNKKRGIQLDRSDESDEECYSTISQDELIEGSAPSSASVLVENEDSEADSQDADFIVEDGTTAPTDILPAQFSMLAHQGLQHHFKIVCQYIIHMILCHPSDKRLLASELLAKDYFNIPLQVLRRKLSGIEDPLASSVWRSEYKQALCTFPSFDLSPLTVAVPECDACRLTGRLSTVLGRLDGSPYDKLTYQIVDGAIDSSNDSDNSDVSDDEDSGDGGEPSFKMEYDLGRFCARRSWLFHRLHHWEFILYDNLKTELAVLARTLSDDPKGPDQILDELDKRGAIHEQWMRFDSLIRKAEDLDSGMLDSDFDL